MPIVALIKRRWWGFQRADEKHEKRVSRQREFETKYRPLGDRSGHPVTGFESQRRKKSLHLRIWALKTGYAEPGRVVAARAEIVAGSVCRSDEDVPVDADHGVGVWFRPQHF